MPTLMSLSVKGIDTIVLLNLSIKGCQVISLYPLAAYELKSLLDISYGPSTLVSPQ